MSFCACTRRRARKGLRHSDRSVGEALAKRNPESGARPEQRWCERGMGRSAQMLSYRWGKRCRPATQLDPLDFRGCANEVGWNGDENNAKGTG